MKKSIKELKEIMLGAREGFKAGKAVRDIVSDGVDASDLPRAFDLIKKQSENLDIYSDAIKDANLAKEELQDLDKQEIIELLMIIMEAVNEVEKA